MESLDKTIKDIYERLIEKNESRIAYCKKVGSDPSEFEHQIRQANEMYTEYLASKGDKACDE